jgi:hypothetical protein
MDPRSALRMSDSASSMAGTLRRGDVSQG